MVLALLAGLFVVIAMVLWTRGSLKKAVTDMGLQLQAASAPVQGFGPVVASMNQAVTNLGSGITAISVQAEKIATLGQRYEEAEKLTKDIHSILIGSYTKGKAGEEALERVMADLARIGLVEANQPLGAGIVEYAMKFRDGKKLAIDSKVVSTKELLALSADNLPDEERSRLVHDIKRQVANKMSEVQKYIDPPNTLPWAVMAVPDSVMEMVTDLIPDAVERNIIILGYSALPQLITSFVRVYEFYAIKEDAAKLKERMSMVQQEISKLDPSFFHNRFDKPIGTLSTAVNRVRQVVSKISDALAIESEEPAVGPLESLSYDEVEERPIPARV